MRAPLKPANTNESERALLDLTPSGDPAVVYRALARVLVRREMIFATSIAPSDDCEAAEAVG